MSNERLPHLDGETIVENFVVERGFLQLESIIRIEPKILAGTNRQKQDFRTFVMNELNHWNIVAM